MQTHSTETSDTDSAGIRLEAEVLAQLEKAVGPEHVIDDRLELEFYATDIYAQRKLPVAVVQPGSVEDTVSVVKIAAQHGLALVPRGGGASYTDGYLPETANSLLIDTGRLNRILEVNAEDMYVTVQAGVTWDELNQALQTQGLRTPFFGPFSGLHATVGGSVAQNSISWGSGTFGSSAESVLGVEVVMADGQVLRTGSWGSDHSKAFFRQYGPDLTGLFTGDAGALGIKTAISLRLIERPPEFLGLSFVFEDFDRMLRGMAAAARLGVSTLNFGLDPTLQQGQLGKTDGAAARAAAWAVFRNSRNAVEGLYQVARMALAGKRFLSGAGFSCHYVVEGIDRAACKSSAAALRKAMAGLGVETANTLPKVVQAMPFAPFHNVLGPKGERWVPLHGLFPFSRVASFRRELELLYERYALSMQQYGVLHGSMFSTVSTNAFLYEAVFYWPDQRNAFAERMVPADYLQQVPGYEPNPKGSELVAEMKQAIIDLMHEHGAVHFQIGKVYPYLQDLNAAAEGLVRAIKTSTDPDGRMNPGALGL